MRYVCMYRVIGIGIVGLWVDSTRRMYVHNGDGVCSIRFNPILCQRSELLYFFFDIPATCSGRDCYHWHIESLDSEAPAQRDRHHTDDSLNARAAFGMQER